MTAFANKIETVLQGPYKKAGIIGIDACLFEHFFKSAIFVLLELAAVAFITTPWSVALIVFFQAFFRVVLFVTP